MEATLAATSPPGTIETTRILAGRPLAEIAAEVPFSDQANLTRQFRRFLGTTPARFRAGSITW